MHYKHFSKQIKNENHKHDVCKPVTVGFNVDNDHAVKTTSSFKDLNSLKPHNVFPVRRDQ